MHCIGATWPAETVGATYWGDSVIIFRDANHLGTAGPKALLPALTVFTPVGVRTLWLAWRDGRFAGQREVA